MTAELEYDMVEKEQKCNHNYIELTASQRQRFESIVNDIKQYFTSKQFCFNGYTGTEKTCLYKTFLHHFCVKRL